MLSVIIATNESERVLVRTLACLVAGATSGLVRDVVLADACSKDETEEIADIAGCRYLALPGPLGPRLAAASAQVRGEWRLFLTAGEELDPAWVADVTQFVERSPERVAAIFAEAEPPRGQGSLLQDLLAVFRSRGSLLKPGRGLLISKTFYGELGGHHDEADCEGALLRRIGAARLAVLRSRLSRRE